MSTTVRLDPETRKRIDSIPFFSKIGKNFSDALRAVIGMGLHSFEENQLATLINQGTEWDICFIAQRHELGIQLSITEMNHILYNLNSLFPSKCLPRQKTIKSITDIFTSVIQSRCFSLHTDTLHIFKKKELLQNTDTSASSPLDIYAKIEEESLNLVKKVKKYENYLENRQGVLQAVKDMLDVLVFLSTPQDNHIPEINIFREIIAPHLSLLIKAAKWETAMKPGAKVIHLHSTDLFCKENAIEPMNNFKSENYWICVMVGESLETSTFICLKAKGVDFHINFYELDELLNLNELLSVSSPPLIMGSAILQGSTLRILLANDPKIDMKVKLFIRSASYDFTEKEWEELTDLLREIEENFAPQLSALRYQLGSY